MGSPPTTTTPPAAPSAADAGTPEPSRGLTFDAEHGLTGNRYISFATRNLPPPAELYVLADDALLVTVTNSQAGLTVYISAQLLLPDGRLSSNQFQAPAPATSTPTQFLFPLTEGYLFNVTVQPAAGVRRGACWVAVAIRRGGLVSGVTLQTLIQDYVDAFSGPTWPGGEIRHSTDGTGLLQSFYLAAGAAGQGWSYTVPANTRLRVRGLTAEFACGAAVATRQVFMYFADALGNTLYQDAIEATQAANSSVFYNWGLLLGFAQTTVTGGSLARGLPDIVLATGCTVQTFVQNEQAADKWQFINFSYEQWFSV